MKAAAVFLVLMISTSCLVQNMTEVGVITRARWGTGPQHQKHFNPFNLPMVEQIS